MSGKQKVATVHLITSFQTSVRMIKPDPIIFITNMTQNWYYRPPFIEGEKGELKTLGGNVFADFFDSLSEGLKDNDYYKVKIIKDKANITFSESQAAELD